MSDLAEVYQRFFVPGVFLPCARLLLAEARPRPGERALDLACGTGVVARLLAPALGPSGHVVALDLRPGMLAVARALPASGAPIVWQLGDAQALPTADARLDLVICQQGLQFFADRAAALREAHRGLAPGGRVVVATWCGLTQHPVQAALIEAEVRQLAALGLDTGDAAVAFSLGDGGELARLLSAAGFHDVAVSVATIEARFPNPERFFDDMYHAYAAVVPALAADPAAFTAFVRGVEHDTRALIDRHRQGNEIVIPMPTNVATASR